MSYQLIAVDLDGTLLDSRKNVRAEDAEALNRALDAGKQVVFSTGRCMGEIRHILPLVPKLRYVLCSGGACIYDVRDERTVMMQSMDRTAAETLLRILEQKDILTMIFTTGQAVISQRDIDNMEHFKMPQYKAHFQTYGLPVESAYEFYWKHRTPIEKINLFHTSLEAVFETAEMIRGLPLTATRSEGTSLELTAENTNKGTCMEVFCKYIQIPLEKCVVIGDSANDLCAMQKAGLAIAMGNAPEEVKAACGAVVADNDHGGVREAVDAYLLR